MRFFRKNNKQDVTKLCTNMTNGTESVETIGNTSNTKAGGEGLDKSEHQEKTTSSDYQEENVEQIRTEQCLKNECDVRHKNSVQNSSDVKTEITANGSSELGANILFNGQIVNGRNNSQDSSGSDDRPCHFGVRSYLHHFYDPPDKEVLDSGEFSQDDFLIDPSRQRYNTCLLRTALWIGINLMIIGITILLIGHLVPKHNTIVGYHDNLQILDRSAIAFNHHLELCRYGGFFIICIGSIVLMTMVYVSKKCTKKEPTYYYVLGATIVPEMFIGNPLVGSQRQINGTILSVRNILNKSKG